MRESIGPGRAGALWALIGVVALIVSFWSPAWHAGLGTTDFPGHVGLLATLQEQLAREPTLPLWTADWYAGAPLLLTYLHPLFSLAALAPFAAVWGPVEGLRVGATFFLTLSAVSMYRFAAAYARSRAGAAIAAAVYALHPSVFVFVGVSGHLHQPVTMAIVPWVFLAWLRLAERATWVRIAHAAVASALLFYDMQRFWIVFPFALALHVARLPPPRGARSARRAILAMLAVGVSMGALLCFPALPGLLDRDAFQWHDSAALDTYRTRHSIPGLLALLDRNGALAERLAVLTPERIVALPGQWYQGIVAMAFVAWGAIRLMRGRGTRADRSEFAFALAMWLVALWFAIGVHPIASEPMLRESWRAGFGVTGAALAAGMLAWLAIAFMAIRTAATARWPNRRAIVDVVTVIGVVAFGVFTPFVWLSGWVFVYGHIRAPGHFGFPLLGFWLATAAAAAVAAWPESRSGRLRRLGFVAGVVALLAIDISAYRDRPASHYPNEWVAEAQAAFRQLRDAPAGRMLDTREYNPLANWLGVVDAGRPLAWGWLAWSSPRHTSELIADGFYHALRRAAVDPRSAARNMQTAAGLAGLANVRFVSEILAVSPPLPGSAVFETRVRSAVARIHENRLVLPYVQFYPELALLSGTPEEVLPALARLSQAGVGSLTLTEASAPAPADLAVEYWFGERARALAPASARPAAEALQRDVVARPSHSCEIVDRRSGRVALACTFARAGYLSIAESWSRHWSVSVDAGPRELIRLNHAFQGVAVARGDHDIEFVHRASPAVVASLGVSAASWLGVGLLGIGAAVRRLRATGDAQSM